jgi:hypothetical protein
MSTRTCTRCGTTGVEDSCPTCLDWFHQRRPDPAGMTTSERLAEFDSWFRSRLPEIGNDLVAHRISELVGGPVHPMDLATDSGRDELRRLITS